MNLYSFLSLFSLAFSLALAQSLETRNTSDRNDRKTPNILLILADDVGTGDIPYYWGSSLVDMPNIDRLSAMGVTFRDAHSTPLCAPSRYMLLSGNYAHRGQRPEGSFLLYETGKNQFMPNQKSIAEVLRAKAGFVTGMFGKWHLGGGIPVHDGSKKNGKKILTDEGHDWRQPLVQGPAHIGFDSSMITVGGIQSQPFVFFRDDYLTIDPSDAIVWKPGEYDMPHGTSIIKQSPKGRGGGEGASSWDSTAYNMIVVNETTAFIDNHMNSDKADNPFFAYVALGSVHTPHSPPNHYLDGSPVLNETQTKHMDMLLEMDKVVGSLVSVIEERGLAQDTIIIFTSDNGGLGRKEGTDPASGHDSSGILRGAKSLIWEGGHRIPLIFRYDGFFPANSERSHLVGLNDIYATLCDLIGVEIPYLSAQDSISFADYIVSKSNTSGLRKELGMWEYQNQHLTKQAIRDGNMKLVHDRTTSNFELYDLDKDISETNNLNKNNDEKYLSTIRRMYGQLMEIGPCPLKRNGKFSISKKEGKLKKCNWFKRKPERCNMFIEGRLYCSSICATVETAAICKSKEFPPTIPDPSCKDTQGGFEYNHKMRSCFWVNKQREKRCKKNWVKMFCPQTCGETC